MTIKSNKIRLRRTVVHPQDGHLSYQRAPYFFIGGDYEFGKRTKSGIRNMDFIGRGTCCLAIRYDFLSPLAGLPESAEILY